MGSDRKIFHAYIISGANEDKCFEKAKELAKTILCGGENAPCGLCSDCRKCDEGIHPDLMVIKAEPGKKNIQVDAIRDMRSDAYTMPNDSKNKVYIIKNAGQMNQNAQNAFLKVLEEPPTFTHFIMTAENTGELLQTVRSRCRIVNLLPEDVKTENNEDAAAFIDAISKNDRMAILRFASYGEKMSAAEGDAFFRNLKEQAAEELRNPKKLSPKMAMKIINECDNALKYLNFNVSMGHITGHILAEFI